MISIVIAAYNEKNNIISLVKRIQKTFLKNKLNYEIILIIEGNDGTYQHFKKSKNNIKIFYSKEKTGFGKSFIKGFANISPKSKLILTMDADLNHEPEAIDSFLKAMKKNNADIVIGSRFINGSKMYKRSFVKGLVSNMANKLFPALLGVKVKDISSGYRLYKRDVIKKLEGNLTHNDFSFLAEILYKSKDCKVIEIPIDFKKREEGVSKFNLLDTFKGYLNLILEK